MAKGLYFAFEEHQESCPELFHRLGLDQFEFDHLPCLINNFSACFSPCVGEKEVWYDYPTTTMFEQGYFWFYLCIYLSWWWGLFFFFFNLLSLKCWYFECISRVHNVICPLKEVILVTAQLFLYGNLYEIRTIRKKYVFPAKKGDGKCKLLLPQFTWVFELLLAPQEEGM